MNYVNLVLFYYSILFIYYSLKHNILQKNKYVSKISVMSLFIFIILWITSCKSTNCYVKTPFIFISAILTILYFNLFVIQRFCYVTNSCIKKTYIDYILLLVGIVFAIYMQKIDY